MLINLKLKWEGYFDLLRANTGAEEPATLIARLLSRRVGKYEVSICFDFHQGWFSLATESESESESES